MELFRSTMQENAVHRPRFSLVKQGLQWIRSNWQNLFLYGVVILPFLLMLAIHYMNLDFWYDEIVSLKMFTFVPLRTTLTDYSFPNNHILFNLINNIYRQVLDIESVVNLARLPFVMRLPSLGYTLITIYFMKMIGKRFFDTNTSVIGLAILVTTVPFYNFAVQIRGYTLAISLMTMLLFFLWRFEEHENAIDAILILLLSSFLLYTLPSNLYILLAIGLYYLLTLVHDVFSGRKPQRSLSFRGYRQYLWKQQSLKIGLLLIVSILFATALYLPILGDLNNDFTRSYGLFRWQTLIQVLPKVLFYFISWRFLLAAFILLVIGWLCLKRKPLPGFNQKKSIFLTVVLLLPFCFSFIRGDVPFLRVFTPLLPIFSLLCALFLRPLLGVFPKMRKHHWIILLVFGVYCYGSFFFALQIRDDRLSSDIGESKKSQDIFFNYYQSQYQPKKLMINLHSTLTVNPLPVFSYQMGDIRAIELYGEQNQISYQPWELTEANQCDDVQEAFVVTAFPNQFLSDTETHSNVCIPRAICELQQESTAFLNVFLCRAPSNPSLGK